VSRYIIIGQHDGTAKPSTVTCYDSYDKALAGAVKFWLSYGLGYEATRPDPFFDPEWCDPECTNVYIHRDDGKTRGEKARKGQIRYVSHSDGDGPCVTIHPEDAP